jgi:hypothetical protein
MRQSVRQLETVADAGVMIEANSLNPTTFRDGRYHCSLAALQ